MATDSKAAITELLSKWDDYQLSQLSRIHRARLEQAIEEEVEGVSFLLTYKGHISVQDHQEVVKLRERGYRVDGSKLLVSLVINQDTHVHRLIWKSFLKLHRILPKLEALLKEMQELASNPTEGLKFVECLSDQAAQLKEHRNLGPTVTIIVEGASGGDAVTSTSRKHGGRKLTRRQKVFKRILPVGSSRQDDQDTVTTKAKQGRIEGSVPMECAPTLEEREGSQPSGSGIRDTIQGHGTGPSEAIACDVGGSLIKESSNLKHGAEHQMLGSPVTTMAEDANRGLDTVTSKSKKDTDPKTAMSELLTQCGDYQLFRLSNFYRERLKPAIEEGVEGLSLMLRDGQHFSGQEHEGIAQAVSKGVHLLLRRMTTGESCTVCLLPLPSWWSPNHLLPAPSVVTTSVTFSSMIVQLQFLNTASQELQWTALPTGEVFSLLAVSLISTSCNRSIAQHSLPS